ncbi:MAG: hypothetical protein EZS28_011616 [Streblomastix strix]|uniref:Uncharacterized protein n=1 Tax=Streblomastix strix TaxID=222440 RepID=A0A5J4WE92_9EUKA|nr:MAG: hypothetical protein EZS28_011616 [Streblomastix strix]
MFPGGSDHPFFFILDPGIKTSIDLPKLILHSVICFSSEYQAQFGSSGTTITASGTFYVLASLIVLDIAPAIGTIKYVSVTPFDGLYQSSSLRISLKSAFTANDKAFAFHDRQQIPLVGVVTQVLKLASNLHVANGGAWRFESRTRASAP